MDWRCYLKRWLRSGWHAAPSAVGSPERQSPTGRAAKGRDLRSQPIGTLLEQRSHPTGHNHATETPPPLPPPPQLLTGKDIDFWCLGDILTQKSKKNVFLLLKSEMVNLFYSEKNSGEKKQKKWRFVLPFRWIVMPCSVIWKKTKLQNNTGR